MFASASLTFELGITTSSWNAVFALRSRVSRSAMGSVIVTRRPPLPRCLRHARDLPGVRHLAETDATEPELAVHRARSAAPATACVRAHLELRLALLLLNECFLGHRSPLGVATEWEPERTQQ